MLSGPKPHGSHDHSLYEKAASILTFNAIPVKYGSARRLSRSTCSVTRLRHRVQQLVLRGTDTGRHPRLRRSTPIPPRACRLGVGTPYLPPLRPPRGKANGCSSALSMATARLGVDRRRPARANDMGYTVKSNLHIALTKNEQLDKIRSACTSTTTKKYTHYHPVSHPKQRL